MNSRQRVVVQQPGDNQTIDIFHCTTINEVDQKQITITNMLDTVLDIVNSIEDSTSHEMSDYVKQYLIATVTAKKQEWLSTLNLRRDYLNELKLAQELKEEAKKLQMLREERQREIDSLIAQEKEIQASISKSTMIKKNFEVVPETASPVSFISPLFNALSLSHKKSPQVVEEEQPIMSTFPPPHLPKHIMTPTTAHIISDVQFYDTDGTQKNRLQEWCQKHHIPSPTYGVLSQSGSAHAPSFDLIGEMSFGIIKVRGAPSTKRGDQLIASLFNDYIRRNKMYVQQMDVSSKSHKHKKNTPVNRQRLYHPKFNAGISEQWCTTRDAYKIQFPDAIHPKPNQPYVSDPDAVGGESRVEYIEYLEQLHATFVASGYTSRTCRTLNVYQLQSIYKSYVMDGLIRPFSVVYQAILPSDGMSMFMPESLESLRCLSRFRAFVMSVYTTQHPLSAFFKQLKRLPKISVHLWIRAYQQDYPNQWLIEKEYPEVKGLPYEYVVEYLRQYEYVQQMDTGPADEDFKTPITRSPRSRSPARKEKKKVEIPSGNQSDSEDGVNAIINDLKPAAHKLGGEAAKGALQYVKEQIVGSLTSMWEKFCNVSEQITEFMRKNLMYIAIISLCICLFGGITAAARALFPTFFIWVDETELDSKIEGLEEDLAELKQDRASIEARKKTFVQQGDGDDSPVSQSFFILNWMALLVKWLGGIRLGISTNDIISSWSVLSKFSVSFKNVKDFVSTAWTVLRFMLNWIAQKTTGIPFFDKEKLSAELFRDYQDLDDLANTIDAQEFVKDPERARLFVDRFNKLHQRAQTLSKHCSTEDQIKISKVLALALPKVQEAFQSLKTERNRVPATWVHLEGPPKQGKSSLMQALRRMVHKGLQELGYFTTKYSDSACYERKLEANGFWSNYHEQPIVTYDDIFQSKEPLDRRTQALELIYAVNSAAFPLSMADLASKGMTWFTSALIFSTSNDQLASITDVGITDVRALQRRCAIHVTVMLKKGSDSMGVTIPTPEQLNNYSLHVKWNGLEGDLTPKQLAALVIINYHLTATAHKEGQGAADMYNDIIMEDDEPDPPPTPVPSAPIVNIPTPTPNDPNFTTTSTLGTASNPAPIAPKVDENITPPKVQDSEPVPAPPHIVLRAATRIQQKLLDQWAKVLRHMKMIRDTVTQTPTFGIGVYHELIKLRGDSGDGDLKDPNFVYTLGGCSPPPTFRNLQAEIAEKEGMDPNQLATFKKTYTGRWRSLCSHLNLQPSDGNAVLSKIGLDPHKYRQMAYSDEWRWYPDPAKITPVVTSYHDLTPDNEDPAKMRFPKYHVSILKPNYEQRMKDRSLMAYHDFRDLKDCTQYYDALFARRQQGSTELLTSINQYLKCDRLYRFVFIGASIAGVAALATAIVSITYSMLTSFGFTGHKEFFTESNDPQTEKIRHKLQRKFMKRQIPLYAAQMEDGQAEDQLNSIAAKSLHYCEFLHNDGATTHSYMLMLKGSTGAIAYHETQVHGGLKEIRMYYNFNDPDSWHASTIYRDKGGRLHQKDFPEIDLSLVTLTANRAHQDITHMLFRKEDYKEGKIIKPARLSFTQKGAVGITFGTHAECDYEYNAVCPVTYKRTVKRGAIQIMNCEGAQGECMAPYFVFNTHKERKLFGLHTGGAEDHCVACPLYYEMVKEYLDEFQDDSLHRKFAEAPSSDLKDFLQQYGIDFKFDPTPYHEGMRAVGRTSRKFLSCNETTLEPTCVLKGFRHCSPPFPNLEAPAQLKAKIVNGEYLDPKILSIRKFKKKKVRAYSPMYFEPTPKIFPPMLLQENIIRPLTLQEAVEGCPECRVPPVSMTKSAGFPDSNLGRKRSDLIRKTDLVKGIVFWVHERVIKRIEYIEKCAKNFLIPHIFAKREIKDELRPHSRVMLFYTRYYNNLEIAHLLHARKWLAAILCAIERYRDIGCTIGINAYSMDWEKLYRDLTRFGDALENIFDPDTSGYDIRQASEIAMAFCEDLIAIGLFLRGSEWHLNVYVSVVTALTAHVVYDDVICQSDQMISGSFETSGINTYSGEKNYNFMFKQAAYAHGSQSLDFYDYNVGRFHGDDTALAMHPDIMHWWNGLVIKKLAFEWFDHELTDPAKGEITKPGHLMEETQFLQRKFSLLQGRVVAPLNPTSLYSMVQYVRRNDLISHNDQLYENINTALFEWSLHGKQAYNDAVRKLTPFCIHIGKPPPSLSFDDQFDRVLTQQVSFRKPEYIQQMSTAPSVTSTGEEVSLTQTTDEQLPQVESQIKFEDTTSVTEQISPDMFQRLYSAIDPYPDETPTTQITKTVQLAELIWNATGISVSGSATSTTFDPISLMSSASPWLRQILGVVGTSTGMYRYFRSDIKIILKLNTTPYHQGCGYIVWAPSQIGTTYIALPYFALGLHPVLFSAMSQDEVSITLPYISPLPHVDFANYTPVWNVNINVLNTLTTTSTSISDTVSITVWGQFTNPRLYGPLQTGLAVKTRAQRLQDYVQQMDTSSSSHKKVVKKEAQTKDALGITAQAAGQLVKPVLESVPFLSPLLSFGKAILESLDKPLTDSSVQIQLQRELRCTNLLTGIDASEMLSSFPSAAVATDIGIDNSSMTVAQYAQLPNFFNSYTITTAGYITRFVAHPQFFGPSTPDYLGFAASMYVYWRGSIKFLFQFVGTAFYSLRVRLTIRYDPNPTAAAIADPTPYFQKIVDIKGDAWTSFSVPFLAPTTWMSTSTNVAFQTYWPYVYVEALTPVLGSSLPATAKYYMNVFRAGGSDIQFAQLRTAQIRSNASKLGENEFFQQTSLRNKFAESFEGIVPGVTGHVESGTHMADCATTIADACHRFCTHTMTGTYHLSYPGETINTGSNPPAFEPFHFWSYGFAFWRGSRRFKMVNGSLGIFYVSLNDSWSPLLDVSTNTLGSAKVLPDSLSTTGKEVIQVEVPFYCMGAYYGTPVCGPPSTVSTLFSEPQDIVCPITSDTGLLSMLAGGDDFRYIFPVPYMGQITKTKTEAVAHKMASVTPVRVLRTTLTDTHSTLLSGAPVTKVLT